jgi:hypothetical protein
MADVTFKVKHGETEVSVTVAGAELSGSVQPAGQELVAEACGQLAHIAVTATGIGKVWDSAIQQNGSIAADQKAAAGASAAEQAARDALNQQVGKLTAGFSVTCPGDCRDYITMMAVPSGERDVSPGRSDDGGVFGFMFWTSTAEQTYRIYYGCARDLQAQAAMLAAIAEQARRIAEQPTTPATRTERTDAAKSAFFPVPGRPGEKLVYLFQPKYLDDLMVAKVKTLKIPAATVESSTGAFVDVSNRPLGEIAMETGEPGESENDRIRNLLSSNPAIRDHVGAVLGKRLPIRFVSRVAAERPAELAAMERKALAAEAGRVAGRAYSTDLGDDAVLAEAMRRLLLRGLLAGGAAPATSPAAHATGGPSPLAVSTGGDDDIDLG